MSQLLIWILTFLVILEIAVLVGLLYLKWKQKKHIKHISDILYRNLIDEIEFYTSIDAIKGDLLEEEQVSNGTWYWHFAYDSKGGFGCYMPMNDLFATPDFSDVLNNAKRSYLLGVTNNGRLESFTPTDLIYDWYLRK